ncbi:MAG TPA: Ig-like domain-containing protein, partial [Spirochaetota bacterium]|nr:Ig-like domain-containing protein [Spirochaetota bacterium]
MKTNKINTILVSLATAIIFIVGAGCHNSFFFGNPSDPTPTTTINSTKRGSLRIYIEKDIKTRTIIADANAITFDQYSIEMTSDDGFADRSGDFTASVADFNNIEAGTWNIAVKAKWSGQVLATGARSGIIIAPNTTTDLTVDIKLSQSATGNVKINIVFPTSSGITSLTAQLDGGASENLTLSVEGIQTTALFEATGVPSGIKDLVLTFKNAAGTILGMYRETVNIFDNLTSDRWINGSGGLQSSLIYPATYFASTNSNLSNLKTSYGLLGFASATYSYSMPVPNSVSTFNVKPTQGIVGQSIFVKFNGGTASMVRTDVSSDNFTLNDGDNTIDVEVTAQDRATKSHYTILVKRAPKPGVPVISGVENGYSYNIDKTLYLSSADSTSIRYTMTNDGSDPSDPTAASSPYSAPIDLTSDAGTKTIYKIKAVGFNSFGDASDVGGVWTVTIDKKPPAIYTLDPTDDATGVNSAAVLAITFDEDVMIDQPDKYVTIYRSIGDSEFEKIQINDNSKINWAAPNKITIDPSGTFWSAFRYYVKIDGGAVKDLAGNSFAGINDSTTWNFKIANTGGAPYITDISSDPVNGSFKQGDSIIIKVKFSEAVTVTGSPTLSLNSGATKATFAGGGLTNTLRFTYTVGAGDNTADLDVTSINLPILPLPAMITDGSNHADLDLPNSPNRLRDNSNIVIDTTKPTIEGGAMSADNSYVTITFSEGVYTNAGASGGLVAGDFSIQLNGGTATGATITGVSSDSGGALSGGESVVRVYFTITGSPSGEETIEIKPVVTNLIYDAAGNSVDTSQTTGQLELNISVAYICGDKDSGIVPVDTTVYTSGETVTVADNTGDNRLIKTRDGISLKLSWNTKADGTGTTYQSGGTFTIGSTSVTLYAMWSALRCTGPAGGLIFYDKGNYIDGWRYLEAATTDLSNSAW